VGGASQAVPADRTRRHILVVDDEPAIIVALTTALKDTYSVHGAATGDEALACLRSQPIAAIILDAVLDREFGLSLVERFRTVSPAPIIVLTGHSSEELAIRALRVGVDDYLRKPPNMKELRATLVRVITAHEQGPAPAERARQYLLTHADRPFTTARLAREVGMSERNLCRQFVETYGMTPRRFLTRVRLERAAELLRTTNLGIEQVAHTVGYPRPITFYKLFKRAFGLAPSEWRAQTASTKPTESP